MKRTKKWMVALLVIALSIGSSISALAAAKNGTFAKGGDYYSFATSKYAYAYTQHTTGACYCRLTVYGSNGSTILYQSTAPTSTYARREYTPSSDTISKTVSAHQITYADETRSELKTLTVTP